MAYVHPKLKRSAFELSYTPILHPVESINFQPCSEPKRIKVLPIQDNGKGGMPRQGHKSSKEKNAKKRHPM